MRGNFPKTNRRETQSQMVLTIFFIVFCAIIIFPFVLLLSVSLSSERDIAYHGYSLLPRQIDLTAYKFVFKNFNAIINAYGVTALFSAITMILGVLLMAMIAYPLSKKVLKGKTFISLFLYFTMLFSGGLVPTYILITQYLRLDDSILVYILPGLISPWYVFMIRSFFQDIPESIAESAFVDGASEYTIFFRIITPLSKPVLATVALFVFLIKWNDWFTSMLYINNENLYSIQYLLQRIMQNIELLQQYEGIAMLDSADVPSETARMAMAVMVAGPALLVFPFFQKYFVRGITVGSVKG